VNAAVYDYFSGLQERIVSALEVVDRKGFLRDSWQRPEGGGGTSCVVEDGQVFERGGVNLSRVQGRQLPPSASAARPELAGRAYEAMGVSLVLHPRNPFCPTVHMNVRYFSAGDIWWFGGGMDLTPYYGFEDDARHFHGMCRQAVGTHYPRFKRWCDEYFHLKHRREPRGIGGIFFDDQAEGSSFEMVKSVGDRFLEAYLPILERRRHLPYG
jgi:coproporphyrinogen III oxidase